MLKQILRYKAREIEMLRRAATLEERAAACADLPPCRGFVAPMRQVAARDELAVIAEIKRASPSKGVIRENFAPAELARELEQHGACALSTLTDRRFFEGMPAHLHAARAAVALPVLRKDFIIDAHQVYETRQMGADCMLLIVAALSEPKLRELAELAVSIGLDILIESHHPEELDVAMRVAPSAEHCLLGVNNRDLNSFETRIGTSLDMHARLSRHGSADWLLVSESGIHTKADIELLNSGGIRAFLIGETLMRQSAPGKMLAELLAR